MIITPRLPIMRSRIMDTITRRIPIRRRIRASRIMGSRLAMRLRRTEVIDCGRMFWWADGLREGCCERCGHQMSIMTVYDDYGLFNWGHGLCLTPEDGYMYTSGVLSKRKSAQAREWGLGPVELW